MQEPKLWSPSSSQKSSPIEIFSTSPKEKEKLVLSTPIQSEASKVSSTYIAFLLYEVGWHNLGDPK